jgi:hypothetical protein
LPHIGAQSVSVLWFAPGGQQPSPDAAVVIGVCEHEAMQVPPLTSASAVHAIASSQLVGHAPAAPAAMPVSHVSPESTTPLPQVAGQSVSVACVAPDGQQPSTVVPLGVVIGVCVHAAVHAEPVIASIVQAIVSSHDAGQAPAPLVIAVSHVSPVSTVPLPHEAEQSGSVPGVAPVGQQPSAVPAAIGVCVHAAVHSLPVSESVVQTMPSSHDAGHAPAPLAIAVSQVSPVSTTPLPHGPASPAPESWFSGLVSGRGPVSGLGPLSPPPPSIVGTPMSGISGTVLSLHAGIARPADASTIAQTTDRFVLTFVEVDIATSWSKTVVGRRARANRTRVSPDRMRPQ